LTTEQPASAAEEQLKPEETSTEQPEMTNTEEQSEPAKDTTEHFEQPFKVQSEFTLNETSGTEQLATSNAKEPFKKPVESDIEDDASNTHTEGIVFFSL
jgi:hypothetical protein